MKISNFQYWVHSQFTSTYMYMHTVGGDGSEVDAMVLFDQLLLADLQVSMAKLDNRVFAEMRSYIDPPKLVLKIIQALLYILEPEGQFDTWKQCKQVVCCSVFIRVSTSSVFSPVYFKHLNLRTFSN